MEKCIVMIPATSTSKNFVPEIAKRGYRPIIIDPFLEGKESIYKSHYMIDQENFFKPYNPIYIKNQPNIEDLIELLKPYDIKAIIPGADFGVDLVDKLNTLLKLPGNSSETTYKRRDKFAQQEALKNAGLRYIKSRVVSSLDEALAFFEETGCDTVVLKPLSGAGSVGMHICTNKSEITNCVLMELSNKDVFGSENKNLLIQEYISGIEFVVNTASSDGVHMLTDMWVYNKIKLNDEGNVYDYIKLLVDISPKHRNLVQYAFNVLDTVEFKYGPCHTEFMVDDKGPVLIEINPRLSGGVVHKDISIESLGYDPIECALDAYIDKESFNKRKRSFYHPVKYALRKQFISEKTAEISYIPGLELFDFLPSINKKNFDNVVKEKHISKTIDLASAPADLWLVHQDESVLMKDYEIIRYIEANCFDLLFEEKQNYTAIEEAEMKKAIFKLQKALRFLPDFLTNSIYILDSGFIGEISNEYTAFSPEDITPDKLPDKIENIVYHCANRFESMEELLKRFSLLIDRLSAGGHFIITLWGMKSLPYGENGAESILAAMGLELEIPMDSSLITIQKIVIGRKTK